MHNQIMIIKSNLTTIKIIHPIIWIFFNVIFFCMAYAVIVDKIGKWGTCFD